MDLCDILAAKSGIDPSGCVELAKHVKLQCPNLEFSGLMTIGMPDYSSTPENFKVMILCLAVKWHCIRLNLPYLLIKKKIEFTISLFRI